jgi:hypothetical protein
MFRQKLIGLLADRPNHFLFGYILFAVNKILAFPVSNELWKNAIKVGALGRCFTGKIG